MYILINNGNKTILIFRTERLKFERLKSPRGIAGGPKMLSTHPKHIKKQFDCNLCVRFTATCTFLYLN